jgi:hypothetical protein
VFRSTRRQRAIAAIVQLSLAFVVAPAGADVEGIRLTYTADSGCPDGSRFFQAVSARTDRMRRAAEGEPARAFVVNITSDTIAIRGALSITALDGSVSKREVTGGSCDEVISALALITALAIDPRASTAPESSPAVAALSSSVAAPDMAPAVPPSDAPPPTGSSIGLVAPTAQRSPSVRDPRALDDSPESPSAQAPYAPAHEARWAVGVEGQSLAGLVPAWGIGGGGFVDVTGSAHGHLIPSLRASFFAVTTQVTFAGAVGADLEWLVARMEACPIRFVWISNLALSFCAAVDVGNLRSTGIGLQTNGTQIRPWVAPAVLARVAWSAADALFFEAGGGLTVPATRYSFYFEQSGQSEPPLQRILPVAATLQIDAGYRLP